MAYDDETPSSEPTLIMPAVPGDGAPPPPLPPSPPGPEFPNGGGGPPGPNPNRTPMIIAGAGAALLVLFAVIFALTRDSDDEVTTGDSTLPLTIATSSLPATTVPTTSQPTSTVPATTLPTTTLPATTAPPTTVPITTTAPTTAVPITTTAPTTAVPITTTVAPTPLCASGDLSVTIGDSEVDTDGAAGSTRTEVYVANTSGSPCVLAAPGELRFTVDGTPVGAALTATSTIDLELAPGGAATALWRMSDAGLFDCTPSDDTQIELVFGDAIATGPDYDPVCETPPVEQGTLEGFTAGMSNLVPG